jgi:hypothetical protein
MKVPKFDRTNVHVLAVGLLMLAAAGMAKAEDNDLGSIVGPLITGIHKVTCHQQCVNQGWQEGFPSPNPPPEDATYIDPPGKPGESRVWVTVTYGKCTCRNSGYACYQVGNPPTFYTSVLHKPECHKDATTTVNVVRHTCNSSCKWNPPIPPTNQSTWNPLGK